MLTKNESSKQETRVVDPCGWRNPRNPVEHDDKINLTKEALWISPPQPPEWDGQDSPCDCHKDLRPIQGSLAEKTTGTDRAPVAYMIRAISMRASGPRGKPVCAALTIALLNYRIWSCMGKLKRTRDEHQTFWLPVENNLLN